MPLRHSPWLLTVAVLAVVTSPARAQDPRGARHALLIAAGKSESGELRDVPYSAGDMDRLAEVFRQGGYQADHIVVLSRPADGPGKGGLPTGEGIRKELKRLAESLSPEDGLIVALSGQAVQFRNDPKTYFCPSDAKLADRSTLLALDELYKILETSRAGSKLVLLDAFHRNSLSDQQKAKSADLLETIARPQDKTPPEGISVLFGCRPGEESHEYAGSKHGVFFHFVAAGLAGEAAEDQDTGVSLSRLLPYVRTHVSATVWAGRHERQEPLLVGQASRPTPIVSLDETTRAWLEGRSLVKTGDFERALVRLNAALKARPTLVPARLERAFAYNALKRYEEAIADANEAMRLDGKNPDISLTGAWYGTYHYPGEGLAPVKFRLFIVQIGERISASTKEPNTFWENDPNVDRDAPFLYAFCNGTYDPSSRELKFTKTYDGAAGASHSVEYSGAVSEDGAKIEGNWNIGGSGASFTGTRSIPGKTAAEGAN